MTEANHRCQISLWILLIALGLTVLLMTVKFWAGWATQSLSLQAETLHTLVSSFSLILSLVALQLPYHRTSRREFLGHGKAESTLALCLVAVLGFASLRLLEVIYPFLPLTLQQQAIANPAQISGPLIQLLLLIGGITLGLALFVRYEARVLESYLLRMSAIVLLRDAWLTLLLVPLLGIVGQGQYWLDPVLGVILIGLVGVNYWQLLNWQLPLMMQSIAIAPEALGYLVRRMQGVLACYQIRSYGIVGRLVFVEIHLLLHADYLSMAPMIAERIESMLRARYGPVQVLLHVSSQDEAKE
ncbi:cation transporter [Trichothermofontia sichuanensis B231]|uniref:cation diffusion facilitator family transporter n=1 Tax=Trichothermofontia sichuanensis TaxID=3045816 RepID=UPI0022483FD9|nr:cation transporter [Trichothermofontia sichuanensis]UZQ53376.1 cation transporter [Trichothermofontia sichuanensis B231]